MTTQRRAPASPLILVYRCEDRDVFASEQEEHEFWSTHAFTEELIAQLDPVSEGDLPPVRPHRSIAHKG